MELDSQEHRETAAEKVASNQVLLAVARVSMALAIPAISVITILGSMYIDQKFASADSKMNLNQSAITEKVTTLEKTLTTKVESVERSAELRNQAYEASAMRTADLISKLSDKLIAVETRQSEDAAQSERFSAAVLLRLDRLQDSQVIASNSIATLTATVQALIEQNRIRNGDRTRLPTSMQRPLAERN